MEKARMSHKFYCLRLFFRGGMIRQLCLLSVVPLLLGGVLGAGCAPGLTYTGQPAQSYAMPSAPAVSAREDGSSRSIQSDPAGQTRGARRADPIAVQPISSTPVFRQVNQNLAALAAQTQSSPADYHLGSEDLLRVTLFNIPEGETGVTPRVQEMRVSQSGHITLPLLGDIQAAGMTTAVLEQDLARRYTKYLHDPQVGVFVTEYQSQRISVIGSVRHPGVFELSGPKTLVDLLALAGGLSEQAGRQVHLYRQEREGRKNYVINIDTMMQQLGKEETLVNLSVQNGDVINVPEADMFFVDGAVKKSGSFHLTRAYTLTQALTSAGGVDIELAKTDEIVILRRRTPTEIDTVPVNLDAIQAGQVSDPRIVPGDVIMVPMSGTKYFVKRFMGTLISGFSLSSAIP